MRLRAAQHVEPVRNKVLKFIEEQVLPLEEALAKEHGAGGMGVGGLNDGAQVSKLVQTIRALQQKAKDQGLWALGHPKEIGGGGMPFVDYIYVNEVQGRSELAPLCLGTHSLQDSLMLFKHASREIQNRYLKPLVQAEIYPSFAMTEPDIMSSDPTGITTRADLVNGNWVINGRKWWTSNAANAAYTCVMVRTEAAQTQGHAAFSIILVPTDTPGYQIVRSTHVLGTHGGDHSEVIYDNVTVPESNLIGQRGGGFLIAQERLGPGRIFHCMRWLGQMQRAYDLMCQRLVERKLRGKDLGSFQLMQQHVFDSYCDISAHRLMTLAAAEKMEYAPPASIPCAAAYPASAPHACSAGDYARVELAACKAWGARALNRVLDRAVQVYGAKGLTDDTPLGGMYRMARAARFYDGPDETHVENLGRLVLREYKHGNTVRCAPCAKPVGG